METEVGAELGRGNNKEVTRNRFAGAWRKKYVEIYDKCYQYIERWSIQSPTMVKTHIKIELYPKTCSNLPRKPTPYLQLTTQEANLLGVRLAGN